MKPLAACRLRGGAPWLAGARARPARDRVGDYAARGRGGGTSGRTVREGGHGSSVGVATREWIRARAMPVATVSTTAANRGPSAAGGGAGRNSQGGADCAVLVDQAGANGAHTPAVQRVHGSTPAAFSVTSAISRTRRRALAGDQPSPTCVKEHIMQRGERNERKASRLAVCDAFSAPCAGSTEMCPLISLQLPVYQPGTRHRRAPRSRVVRSAK